MAGQLFGAACIQPSTGSDSQLSDHLGFAISRHGGGCVVQAKLPGSAEAPAIGQTLPCRPFLAPVQER